MKTFRDLLSEVAQPRGKDEKRFKDKHVIVKHNHPVAGDHVFTGAIQRAPKRLADYDYEIDEDEIVYEASVFDVPTAAGGEYDEEKSHQKYKKGNKSKALHKESKMDAVGQEDDDIDNDGDVDSSDRFLHARRRAIKKAMKKEAYSDVHRNKMSKTYKGKNPHHINAMSSSGGVMSIVTNNGNKYTVTAKETGGKMPKTGDHINKWKPGAVNEEVEGLDEISKSTAIAALRKRQSHADDFYSWPNDQSKADATFRRIQKKFGSKTAKDAKRGVEIDRKGRPQDAGPIDYLDAKSHVYSKFSRPNSKKGTQQRLHYMKLNKGSFKKEEAESLDEISRDTARSYIRKAMAHKATGETSKKDRSSGVNLAGKKAYGIGGKARINATEEAEQLDELSPNTLKNYAGKAFSQANTLVKQSLSDQPKSVEKASKAAFKRRSAGIKAAGRRLGSDEMKKIHKNVVGESVEQLDELSPNALHSYIKKAAGNLAGNAALAAAQASSSMKKSSPEVKRNIKNRMRGITGASGRLADKANADMYESEELDELNKSTLASYVKKAADSRADAASDRKDYKIGSALYNKMKKTGDKRKTGIDRAVNRLAKEEFELDESITKMPSARLKFHATKKLPHGSFSNSEIADEHDRRKRTDPNYHSVKPSLNEVTRSAIKKTVSYVGSDGKSHSRNVPIKSVKRDEYGQDKIRSESFISETFKAGNVRLNDGSSVTLKSEDANLLNQMFDNLNEKNRKVMQNTLMSSKKGFNEIVSFAREAL
jgi:hypothetical protein